MARRHVRELLDALEAERRATEGELGRTNAEIRAVVAGGGEMAARLADLQERVQGAERRLAEIREEEGRLQGELVDEAAVADALGRFDPVWDALSPREKARVLELLIERVDYDGADGTVSVIFRPTGIRALGEEFRLEEDAA